MKKFPVLLTIAFGTATAIADNATLDGAIGRVAGAAIVGAAVGTARNVEHGARHGSSRPEPGHGHPAPRDKHPDGYFRLPGQASKGRC